MRRFKATLAYDGGGFCGWQIQPRQPTVQGVLQEALAEIEGGPVAVQGSGRTDAGVHALAQVASFDLRNPIPAANLQKAINRLLPEAVRVLSVEEAPAGFHARHAATAKTYEYRIWRGELCPPFLCRYVWPFPYPLDEAAMMEAAPAFEGAHDFRSLAASGGQELESTVRTVFCSRLERASEQLVYRVRGTGFLYRMVRNIVGTLVEVGRSNLKPAEVAEILAARRRSAAGPTVPARGLFLVHVEYAEQGREVE